MINLLLALLLIAIGCKMMKVSISSIAAGIAKIISAIKSSK